MALVHTVTHTENVAFLTMHEHVLVKAISARPIPLVDTEISENTNNLVIRLNLHAANERINLAVVSRSDLGATSYVGFVRNNIIGI